MILDAIRNRFEQHGYPLVERHDIVPDNDWLESERILRDAKLASGRRMWRKHKDKDSQWWFETAGLTEVDLAILREENRND